MNKKECFLRKIVEIVVGCCATQIDDDGTMSVTADDVLGGSRRQNAVMTRCVLVRMIIFAGYSTTTVAQLLGISETAVRNLERLADSYHKSSRAYRIAEAEATLKCRDIEEGI